jgi:hypothetical protein
MQNNLRRIPGLPSVDAPYSLATVFKRKKNSYNNPQKIKLYLCDKRVGELTFFSYKSAFLIGLAI